LKDEPTLTRALKIAVIGKPCNNTDLPRVSGSPATIRTRQTFQDR
jgi:hypothetical protein